MQVRSVDGARDMAVAIAELLALGTSVSASGFKGR